MFHYIWFFFMHYFSCFKILLFTIYFFFLHLFVYHVLVVRNNYGVNKLDWAYSNWNLQNQKGLFPAPPMISLMSSKSCLIPSLSYSKSEIRVNFLSHKKNYVMNVDIIVICLWRLTFVIVLTISVVVAHIRNIFSSFWYIIFSFDS